MISERTYLRVLIGAGLLFAVISFTSTFSGVVGLSQYRPVGYLYGFYMWFDHSIANISEPITYYFLRTVLFASAAAFSVGMIGSLILLLVLICVCFIPYLIVLLLLKIASISIVGAFIVFAIVAMILSALLRRYWQATAEAIAWVVVLIQGLWNLIVLNGKHQPQQQAAVANVPATYGRWGRGMMANTPEKPERTDFHSILGDLFRKHNVDKDKSDALPISTVAPVVTAPSNIFESLTSSIRATQATNAIKKQTEMVSSVNNLETAIQQNYDLETKRELQPEKRLKETISAHTDVFHTAEAFENAQARYNAAKASPNPIDREFEQDYKPKEKATYSADLYRRRESARAIKEALKAMTAELKEVDEGAGSEEDKKLAKLAIRAQYASLLNPKTNTSEAISGYEKSTRD